jgi:hypothetical protein
MVMAFYPAASANRDFPAIAIRGWRDKSHVAGNAAAQNRITNITVPENR